MKSFKYFWQDFSEGQEAFLGTHKVSEKDILEFGRKFDPQYFHTDPVLAKESPFGGLIACGWHTCAIMMRLMCNNFLVDTATMGAPAAGGPPTTQGQGFQLGRRRHPDGPPCHAAPLQGPPLFSVRFNRFRA